MRSLRTPTRSRYAVVSQGFWCSGAIALGCSNLWSLVVSQYQPVTVVELGAIASHTKMHRGTLEEWQPVTRAPMCVVVLVK